MNMLTRHALVAATAALAVAAALTMVAQDVGAAPVDRIAQTTTHTAAPAGEALLLAAADMFCVTVSGS